MTAAVATAIANGATAEQLAPITDEVNALKGGSDVLSAAVAAGTAAVAPPAPVPSAAPSSESPQS